MNHAARYKAAASAWANGLTAATNRQLETARLWLERAVKLAPADPRIGLDLANIRIALNTPGQLHQARAELAVLAGTHSAAAIELACLSAAHLSNAPQAAAAALTRLLQHHCIPADPDFPAVASMIVQAAGLIGWCGITPAGRLHIAAPDGPPLSITCDHAPLAQGALAQGAGDDDAAVPASGILRVTRSGVHLAGSPLDLAAFNAVAGIVSAVDGGLAGWAYRPAAPQSPPRLVLRDVTGAEIAIKPGSVLPPDEAAPFMTKFSFAIGKAVLRALHPPFHITGAAGSAGAAQRDIMGSPLNPAALAAIKPIPAGFTASAVTTAMPARAALAVVIPAYRNLGYTQACIASVQASAPPGTSIIVIDDASPEPALSAWLRALAVTGEIKLIQHAENQGFPAAANAGFAAAGGRDVLLLNSDTLIPPGALTALADAAYAALDIASATPFSNDATILSLPAIKGGNKMPDMAQATANQQAAAAANDGQICEIPTGVGFCMFIRHDCLAATGKLRPEIFAQGYGEENDWCLRARHLGYRHVAALGAYVGHHGSASFRGPGAALNARNARILNRLYPGYDALIANFIAQDPLAPARRRFDAARFAQSRREAAVLLISHNHGGGVARIIHQEMQRLREAGIRPLLLVPGGPDDPEATPFPWEGELTDGKPGDYPNLRFNLPDDHEMLLALLRAEAVSHVVFHHGLGHQPGIRHLAADLGVPQDIVLHDYASFCPRVNLLTHADTSGPLRYCGEPSLAACEICVERAGDETFEYLGPAALVARSAGEFASARRITAPSADAANRIARHFPAIRPEVTPWQDDRLPVRLFPPKPGARRIVIIGGIGPAKGFDLLIECAQDAVRRKLPLEFIVAGASADDAALLETGRIFVTGAYAEGEATALIATLHADLAFLPSIWPETWCFALSEAWQAGLYALAFDLGAQAARLKATGRGAVLPLGLPVPRINDILLSWQPDPRQQRDS